MKTKEELNALKKEVENVRKELSELTEEELKLVTGGVTLHNLPRKTDDEKYVMSTRADRDDLDTGKDHYERII